MGHSKQCRSINLHLLERLLLCKFCYRFGNYRSVQIFTVATVSIFAFRKNNWSIILVKVVDTPPVFIQWKQGFYWDRIKGQWSNSLFLKSTIWMSAVEKYWKESKYINILTNCTNLINSKLSMHFILSLQMREKHLGGNTFYF